MSVCVPSEVIYIHCWLREYELSRTDKISDGNKEKTLGKGFGLCIISEVAESKIVVKGGSCIAAAGVFYRLQGQVRLTVGHVRTGRGTGTLCTRCTSYTHYISRVPGTLEIHSPTTNKLLK